ncbi:DUF5677 domain-containing protein [Candidatus Palauibacter sp.]|uniref:DUF5677 domain-containing protein n=1 Tax=Candidatus Palauibacter sp. TaxID=3101350 RepID=UPI003B02E17E
MDRDTALKKAEVYSKAMQPTLQETINYATGVLSRCMASVPSDATPDVHLSHFALFRKVVELADAIDVQMSQGCIASCTLPLRSLFEALLGLQYQLESRTKEDQRTLAWVCGDIHQRLRASERFRDGELTNISPDEAPDEVLDDTLNHIQAMLDVLSAPHMEEVEKAYHDHPHPHPRWYSLFDGPANLEQLARRFEYEDVYNTLYREWSAESHAQGGLQQVFRQLDDGRVAMRALRRPDQLPVLADLTIAFVVQAIVIISNRFRPDEAENNSKWYMQNIQPVLNRLGQMKIDVDEDVA